MGRILAIDYGKKKTGIAVTDPLQIIANGLTTVPTHEIMTFLDNYFQKESVEMVVIGYPTQTTGEESESMRYITPFVNRLKNKYPNLPVEWVDERFTSKMAFQTMIDSGLSKKQRKNKNLVDEIAATILLQDFLTRKMI